MQTLAASINAEGRIELRGSYNAALMDFYHSLPAARWNKSRLCWSCENTPATCWRIVSEAAVHARVEADQVIRDRGAEFFRGTTLPPRFDQPEIFKTRMWRHQCEAYWFAMQRKASLLSMSMGTGKSLVAINVAQNSNVKTLLIVCPVSVRGVWRREFEKHAAVPFNVLVLDMATTSRKTRQVAEHMLLGRARNERAVVVMNYESCWRAELKNELLKTRWDMMVCDEAHRAKGYASKQSHAVEEIGRTAARKLALTGTPMQNSPLDIYGLMRFLDRGIFG